MGPLSDITKQNKLVYAGFVSDERQSQIGLFSFNISAGIGVDF